MQGPPVQIQSVQYEQIKYDVLLSGMCFDSSSGAFREAMGCELHLGLLVARIAKTSIAVHFWIALKEEQILLFEILVRHFPRRPFSERDDHIIMAATVLPLLCPVMIGSVKNPGRFAEQ
jgi:hypothetical protein